MCIAYFQIGNQEWPLFIAANRDEFHNRPTKSAGYWPENQNIISGIDLQGGGTWLGINKNGRYAFLTNFRDLDGIKTDAATRGNLVSDFLVSNINPEAYIKSVYHTAGKYNGFNLVVGDTLLNSHYYISNSFGNKPNYISEYSSLDNGHYILSNHLLNTPWPKSKVLLNNFKNFDLNNLHRSFDQIFSILKDNDKADDDQLPSTGISFEFEKLLSSPFIISNDYGTRCSSIIAIHKSGKAYFCEATYDTKGIEIERNSLPFVITAP